jgi:ribosomal protein S18 acetylase RimI-like enzyme
MSNFPDDFSAAARPIRAANLDEAGAAAIAKLAESGFEVRAGLTPELAEQIIQMALEPGIREYCPNDSGQRFKNIAATKDWLAKKRGTFVLLKPGENDELVLAGYGWAGDGASEHVPGGETTFSIRIGEAGQGQGLASSFAWLIVAASAELYGARDFWLETWASNGGAVHTYHKIGFKDVAQQNAQRPTNSGGQIDDTRLYMSLDNERLPKNDAALSSSS